MAMNKYPLSLCSYNCRSLKKSEVIVHDLCNKYDIMMLQEHWLFPHDLSVLNYFHKDFYGTGMSAIDTSSNLVTGRPFGGTAVLYRKCFANSISPISTNNARITGVNISSTDGKILLLNVYMPCNYGDDDSLQDFIECICQLQALIIESDAIHTLICGDFNAGPTSRFFPFLSSFINENNLLLSDMTRLCNACTYISDDGLRSTWIDHIVCSANFDDKILDVEVLQDVIMSDHRPLVFKMECSLDIQDNDCVTADDTHRRYTQWNLCNNYILQHYQMTVDKLLQNVQFPYRILATGLDTNDLREAINTFYCDIIYCLRMACDICIPYRGVRDNLYNNIPGWNTHVKELLDIAREWYLVWRDYGKPRSGVWHENMCKSRAKFKLALRYCKQHIEELKADACANSVLDKDARKFWHDVYRISNAKATVVANTVGGAVGDKEVTDMWKKHFENLYSEQYNELQQNKFLQRITSLNNTDCASVTFSVNEVVTAISQIKTGKAAGPDGIAVEAYKYGGHRLAIYLTLLFNLCLWCNHLPKNLICSLFVPLVKNKSGDLTDVNNYRAIAISNSCSKILELAMYNYFVSIQPDDFLDDHQFGFKKSHSTGLCTHIFKRTVDYYIKHGSNVFSCFVDFKKAFDYVDYWHLFTKLFDNCNDPKSRLLVRLLSTWYSTQSVFVRWKQMDSDTFEVQTGVRQGGVLSPYLFRFYVRDMIRLVTQMRVGCCIDNTMINLLCFADDMVLVAPSWNALQFLIDMLFNAASSLNMQFNTKKTVCMIFNPLDSKKVVCCDFPAFTVDGAQLTFVDSFKYLGNVITNDLRDDADIEREIKCLFTRCNILLSRFQYCSRAVKLRLFQSYCLCFYNCALWHVYNKKHCVDL